MEATGRMKDFYDIYYLATTFDFEGRKLQEAIYETLSNRGMPYEKDSVVVIVRLAKDSQIQKRWDNFCPNGGGDRLKRTMLKGIVLSVS